MQLVKVCTDDSYDFYIGHVVADNLEYPIYNIVPKGTEAPQGGYMSVSYIEHIKHVKFPREVLSHE